MNKGRPGGRLGEAKGASPRPRSQRLRVTPRPAKGEGTGRSRSASGKSATSVKPAGRGGPKQWAGGPEHHGLDASEDRNP
jgi:hypothetical protein